MSGHDHSHDHGLGHDHSHGSANRTRLAIALGITGSVLVIEVVGSLLTGSLALLVDAGHMLTDSLGLVVALIAATLMSRPPSAKRTYGWKRAEVISAATQALILLGVAGYAAVEGIGRFFEPHPVASSGLLIIGVLGLLANVAALAVLAGGRGSNLNMRAAFLEVLGDALGSVAVIVAAIVISITGWSQADAVAGLIVAGLILPRAVALLRASGSILLESTPAGLDLDQVRQHLEELPHVRGVHDLHASRVSSDLPILSAHVILDDECFTDGHCQEILASIQACLVEHHDISIEHSTIQLESASVATRHLDQLHA